MRVQAGRDEWLLSPESSDDDLVALAVTGEPAAFEELYRRHAPTALRLAQAVTGNAHDAADAVADAFARILQSLPRGALAERSRFAPYLLTATRNAAIDVLRRSGRVRPTANADLEAPSAAASPADRAVNDLDRALVAAAFRSLPERWRSVLWLTEVEGLAPRDAAIVLHLSPNGVSQLAVRARARLRERFLQAHLGASGPPACRACTSHLGSYVAGALAPRELAKVDQHLAGCPPCRERLQELEEVGTTLRRALLPVPLAGSALLRPWRALSRVANALARPRMGVEAAAHISRPLIGVTLGLAGLGLAGTVTGLAAARQPAPVVRAAALPRAATPSRQAWRVGVANPATSAAAPVDTGTATSSATGGSGPAAASGLSSAATGDPAASSSTVPVGSAAPTDAANAKANANPTAPLSRAHDTSSAAPGTAVPPLPVINPGAAVPSPPTPAPPRGPITVAVPPTPVPVPPIGEVAPRTGGLGVPVGGVAPGAATVPTSPTVSSVATAATGPAVVGHAGTAAIGGAPRLAAASTLVPRIENLLATPGAVMLLPGAPWAISLEAATTPGWSWLGLATAMELTPATDVVPSIDRAFGAEAAPVAAAGATVAPSPARLEADSSKPVWSALSDRLVPLRFF